MVCEKCQQLEATVHVTGGRTIESPTGQPISNEKFEHHFCEACASKSLIANPELRYGPGTRTEELRVISVSGERTVVRLVRTETQPIAEEWTFLTSRLPPQYAVVGLEFRMTFTPAELEHLMGLNNC